MVGFLRKSLAEHVKDTVVTTIRDTPVFPENAISRWQKQFHGLVLDV